VHAFDLAGHGRSEGVRGYVASFDDAIDDTRLMLTRLGEALAVKAAASGW
jgi:alpha-beta hydrolase superfamily lysophospholipase